MLEAYSKIVLSGGEEDNKALQGEEVIKSQ